jgi:hypothetical protein
MQSSIDITFEVTAGSVGKKWELPLFKILIVILFNAVRLNKYKLLPEVSQ